MSEDTFNGNNLPDFSGLTKFINRIQDIMQPVYEAQKRIQNAFIPVIAALDQYKSRILETSKAIIVALQPIATVEALADAQFVYWLPIDNHFINSIISSSDINDTLEKMLIENDYVFVFHTSEKIKAHPLMESHLRLYSQSFEAFTNGFCDLAVTGMTSVFDGLLSLLSNNSTHKLKPRIDNIKSKLEKDEIPENDEYAMLILAITLEKSLDLFSAYAPFDKPEPDSLNRNWIAHGRYNRIMTKLDCVKLINMIFGLLLVYDIEQKEDQNFG